MYPASAKGSPALRNPFVSMLITIGLILGKWFETRAHQRALLPSDSIAFGPDLAQSI